MQRGLILIKHLDKEFLPSEAVYANRPPLHAGRNQLKSPKVMLRQRCKRKWFPSTKDATLKLVL